MSKRGGEYYEKCDESVQCPGPFANSLKDIVFVLTRNLFKAPAYPRLGECCSGMA